MSAVMKEPVITELEAKKAELTALRKEVESISNRLQKAQSWLNARPDSQLNELRSQIKDAKNILQDQVIIVETASDPSKQETSRLDKARITLEDLESDHRLLQAKITQMSDSIPRLTRELSDLNRQKKALIKILRHTIAKQELHDFGPAFMQELAKFHTFFCHAIPVATGSVTVGKLIDVARGNMDFKLLSQHEYDLELFNTLAKFDKTHGLEK